MAVKVTQHNDECIGCGACVAIDPDNWKMNGDKADLVGAEVNGNVQTKTLEEEGNVKKAADACPVNCIKVEEE